MGSSTDAEKSDIKINFIRKKTIESINIKQDKDSGLNKIILKRRSTMNTTDVGTVNSFQSDLMQSSKILGNRINPEERGGTKKYTVSINCLNLILD